MKRIAALLLIFALAAALCSCGTTEQPPEEVITRPPTQTTTTEKQGPSEELLLAVKPFQGEWTGDTSSVIVCDEKIHFIHDYDIVGKHYTHVYTFYFAFSEDGTLIINNEHGQPRKSANLLENGTLQIQNIGEDEPEIFQWRSDSTTVPAERDDPKIGMTEAEVYASSWGYPKNRNKTTTSAGTREQLVYDFGYIYLTNGIVTAIQER